MTKPRVLITRPAAQTERFETLCRDAGFLTVSLPCIEIQFMESSLSLASLQREDEVLFTSANAVEGARRRLPFPWHGVPVRAIGPATEQALLKAGQAVTAPAIAPYNSEAFMKRLKVEGMPERLTIIKGDGGREWLVEALREHGVTVTSQSLYRRALPVIDDRTRLAVFESAPIHIVSVTSDEVLHNLLQIAGDDYRERVLALPLICNSQRCAELARTSGFSHDARVAMLPGDAGQLAQLKHWRQGWLSDSAAEI